MYKQYDENILNRLKKCELIILHDFDEACQKYNIPWFAIGGAAIGSERHKGFIPWDDDLDIGMLRDDYDRFLRVWEKELGKKYVLVTPETSRYYSSAVIKLMRKGTKFVPEYALHKKGFYGIHIDIFVYDHYTNDERSAKQIRQARFLDMLMVLKTWGHPEIPYKGLKQAGAVVICEAVHYLMCIFHVSSAYLFRQFLRVSEKYNNEETEYVTTFADARIHDIRIARDELFPLKEGPFENGTIPLPNKNMILLKRYYGDDVMEMPPVEKRVNHAPAVIDFGDMDKVR